MTAPSFGVTTPIPGNRLVTVFGGSGFLGRHIVRALAKCGWRIRVAVRRANAANFLLPLGRVGQVQILKCNVADADQVEAALAGANAAVNLVGILAQSGRQRYTRLHVEAAGSIARLAKEAGATQLVHVSALGVAENAPAAYFRTKWEGEQRIRAEFPDAVIVRPSIAFGPEDTLFNRFAWLMRLTLPFSPFPLFGGGTTRFQPVYAGDIAAAVAQILSDPASAARTYELGGPEVMTLREILEFTMSTIRRKRFLLPVPLFAARAMGAVFQFLPLKLFTLDQARMLETDTVLTGGEPGLKELRIEPATVGAVVPTYLWRFRKSGEFEPVTQ
jgi:NADH dehydrogenase